MTSSNQSGGLGWVISFQRATMITNILEQPELKSCYKSLNSQNRKHMALMKTKTTITEVLYVPSHGCYRRVHN